MTGEEESKGRRVPAIVALIALAVVVVVLFATGGDEEYRVTAEFENASQLVTGNQVVVGGQAVGTVKEIGLAADGQAQVSFNVEDEFAPLKRGTVATVRWTSLSSVAARQVQLTVPPANAGGEEIPDGGVLGQSETVSQVEIDQIFNTLDERTIEDLRRVIQGFERSYEGVAEKASRGYRYMNPLFSTSRRVFHELSADQPALERLLVDGAQFSGALADRATDVSALIGNLSRMTNAIGERKDALAQAIALLPPFMRNANTAFVNLRAALDDLDPLVVASRPAARELTPFLAKLRETAADAVPTVRDLSDIVRRPGTDNDLVELQRIQPKLRDRALGTGAPDCGPGPEHVEDLEIPADDDFTQGAFGEALCSLSNGHHNLSFFRAYTPELVGWFDDFSHSGYSDAIGGISRIGLTLNTFSPSFPLVPDLGDVLSPEEQLAALDTGNSRRCPGSNERPLGPGYPADASVPFTDEGHLTDGVPGDCDPTQVQPGP